MLQLLRRTVRRWLRHELRDTVEDLLSERSVSARGLFDPAAVARMRAMDAAGRIDAAYPLLALCAIELWCRVFLALLNFEWVSGHAG